MTRALAFAACVAIFATICFAAESSTKPWIGVHVLVNGKSDLDKVAKSIPPLGKMGVNAIILQVDYNFDFESHPELRNADPITKAQAREIADLCRANHIRPIPSLNCLGHQSWSSHTGALLTKHPDLDETPGKFPNNKDIYCRSWCPLNPDVNKTVFPLIDEEIDAFGADAFHVGMDEVFIMADPDCPRCKGKNPGELFARQVNDLHDHIVKQRKVEMMIWGDRLLDSKKLGYSKWEASANNTAGAVDLIPKDIVICDWHYEPMAYKSVPFILEKGFRVWPSGWHKLDAAEKLMDDSLAQKNPRMVGYLSTTWGKAKLDDLQNFPPTKLAVQKFAAHE